MLTPKKQKEGWEKRLEELIIERFPGDYNVVQFYERQLKSFISAQIKKAKSQERAEIVKEIEKMKKPEIRSKFKTALLEITRKSMYQYNQAIADLELILKKK